MRIMEPMMGMTLSRRLNEQWAMSRNDSESTGTMGSDRCFVCDLIGGSKDGMQSKY